MNKMEYYRLEKTENSKDFYFANEGMYNFWDEYLICRIKNKNIVIVNRPGKVFEHFDTEFIGTCESNIRQEIKDRFCGARGCCDAHMGCAIVQEWNICLQSL